MNDIADEFRKHFDQDLSDWMGLTNEGGVVYLPNMSLDDVQKRSERLGIIDCRRETQENTHIFEARRNWLKEILRDSAGVKLDINNYIFILSTDGNLRWELVKHSE